FVGDGKAGFGRSDHNVDFVASSAFTVADFNGDGRLDLAVTVPSFIGVVYVPLNTSKAAGNITFRPSPTYPVGQNPRSAATGDFNGDGKLDLIVANSFSDYVSILMNQGNGTFSETNLAVGGNYIFAVAPADFNGDGKVDFAVTYGSSGM